MSHAVESRPDGTAKKDVVEVAEPFSVESMDMEQLAATFGVTAASVYWRYQEYPAAVAQLDLSDQQKVKLIAALRVCRVGSLTEERRNFSLSRIFEHWGKYGNALDEMKSPEPSLHRVRVLLRSGNRAAAMVEGKLYFKASSEDGYWESPFTGFPLEGLTHPYVAMDDLKGMGEYLELLAELSPWHQDVRMAQLDLAYHLGTLDKYAAQLKKKHPIRYIIYLQQVGRYADALESLDAQMQREPLSFPQLVFLAPQFKNHQLLQPVIQEMISSGKGGVELRKNLLVTLVQGEAYRMLENLELWMKTHPEELDRWANHFAYKMIPKSGNDVRRGQFLDDLHRIFPENPAVSICLARKLMVQHGESASGVNEILSRVVHRHLREKSINHTQLPNWLRYSDNYWLRELDLAEPVAVALTMLRTRLNGQALLTLLHEAPKFAKLPLAQKARYYAIARLDRPFIETMLSLDWSRPENDTRAMWLRSYFDSFYFKDSIPVEYLDALAGKLSTITMGSSGKYKTHSSYKEFAPLLKILLEKHPQPETLKLAMQKLALAIKTNLDLDTNLVFPSLMKLERNYSVVEGIFESQKVELAKKQARSARRHSTRLPYAIKIFSAPDIKRIQPQWNYIRSKTSYRFLTRNMEKYRGLDPLKCLVRRNRGYAQFRMPAEMEAVLRSSYPGFSERALAYDLLQQLLLSKKSPAKIYEFLKTLDQNDSDYILFEATIQLAHKPSDQQILKTLSRLKSAPVLHRNRAIKFAEEYDKVVLFKAKYSRSGNRPDDRSASKKELIEAVTQLMDIEPRVGLVRKPEETLKEDLEERRRSLEKQFVEFRDAKQYQSQECQDLAKKVLWSLVNGSDSTATAVHYQAMAAMEHIGGLKKFITEVDRDLKSREMDELQRLKRIRRFYSYSSSGQKLKKLSYSWKIQALDPQDVMAAKDLLPEYVKKSEGKWVMRCLRVIFGQLSDPEVIKALRQNPQLLSVLSKDQVGELLHLLRIKPLNDPHGFGQYLATILPKSFERNERATREYLEWLMRSGQEAFTIHLLNATLKIGWRKLVAEVVWAQLFPVSDSSLPAKLSVRFGKPKMLSNRRSRPTDSELFRLIIGSDLAKDLLELRVGKRDAIPIGMVRNRFMVEMLAAPSKETYRRIAPRTVGRVSVQERAKISVTLGSLLQGVSGTESLQLFLSQTMVMKLKQMRRSEISRFFKLAYLAKDADAVESTWNHLEAFIKEEKIKESPEDYFLRSDEYCLMSTLLYGSDRRWRQLMQIFSQNKRYDNKSKNSSFVLHILKEMEKVTEGDLRDIPPIRGRMMLEWVMLKMRERDRRPWSNSGTEHAVQWALLAAQLGDDRAMEYFYPKAVKKVSRRSSHVDAARDELDFWMGVMKGDPAVANPVVHAYRSGNQWHALWSLSGIPHRPDDLGLLKNIVPRNKDDSQVRYALTILAGPSPNRLDEVKVLSEVELSGTTPIQLPKNARWLGLMMKQNDGKAVRWASPIKLTDARASKVNIKEEFSKQVNLALPIELYEKAGPFGQDTSVRLELPSRQKAEANIRLFPLSWKPGDTIFASAWLKPHGRASASLAVGFYGKSDKLIGSIDLQRSSDHSASLLQTSWLPDSWEYVSTSDDESIPPLAHRAVLILKTKHGSASSLSQRFLELADIRIQIDPLMGDSEYIRRIGRVPGAMYYLSAADDDQRMILVDKNDGMWIFDVKRGSSSKVLDLKGKRKVFWARLNGDALYYLDNQQQFRGVDIKTGKETVHQSLAEIGNSYAKLALSPNGKWLAVGGDGNRKINIYQIQENEIVKMKPIPLPEGVTERQFSVRHFDFDAASNLTILASKNYWQWSVETRTIKQLGESTQRGDNPPFGPQGTLFFDRPLISSNRWLDPKRKQQIEWVRSSRGVISIKYYAGGKKQTINLPNHIPKYLPVFTLFPKSGEFLYVDTMGILWQVASPLQPKE